MLSWTRAEPPEAAFRRCGASRDIDLTGWK
jgi:hypothetical protein